jgi:hypothetical protein
MIARTPLRCSNPTLSSSTKATKANGRIIEDEHQISLKNKI